MVGEGPYNPNDDIEHDSLAGLDFSGGQDEPEVSALDILAEYSPAEDQESGQERADAPQLFSVTNPPGTVTVSTSMDGRVHEIELSSRITDMTETDLAEEIVVIADLATQQARSAQYELMLQEMRNQGHDDVATRDFLTRDLDLPTPDQVEATRLRVFTTRYTGGDD